MGGKGADTVKSLSVFSGCLGLDLGLERAGIEAVAYVDFDKACQDTIRANCPGKKIFGNIFDNDVLLFAKNAAVDVIAGGPPCQSFSTIGRRCFLDDDRGKAMLAFVRLIEGVRPKYFVLENVRGIISAGVGDKSVVRQLEVRFQQAGYSTIWDMVDAADFGVPQHRKRFIMLGCLKGEVSHLVGKIEHIANPVTLRDVISDLENCPGECLEFSDKMRRIMDLVPEGGCWKSLPARIQKKAMGNATLSSGGLTAFYRRLSYDKPSPTLLTTPTQRATTLCHPKRTRPLSVSEYKRLQCFSDSWEVCGSTGDKYRQLGNAVPVLLGMAIGKAITRSA